MSALFAYTYNWQPVQDRWHALLVGAWMDVWITLISFVLACLLGVAIALLRISGLRVLRVWNNDVFLNLEGVGATILAACRTKAMAATSS